jgi:hypothetical protein
VVLLTSALTFGIQLPLGVVGHEGSTILVVLNGLRLLRTPSNRQRVECLTNTNVLIYSPQAVTFRRVGGPGQGKNASEEGHSRSEKPTIPAAHAGHPVPLPGRAATSRNPRRCRAPSAARPPRQAHECSPPPRLGEGLGERALCSDRAKSHDPTRREHRRP